MQGPCRAGSRWSLCSSVATGELVCTPLATDCSSLWSEYLQTCVGCTRWVEISEFSSRKISNHQHQVSTSAKFFPTYIINPERSEGICTCAKESSDIQVLREAVAGFLRVRKVPVVESRIVKYTLLAHFLWLRQIIRPKLLSKLLRHTGGMMLTRVSLVCSSSLLEISSFPTLPV